MTDTGLEPIHGRAPLRAPGPARAPQARACTTAAEATAAGLLLVFIVAMMFPINLHLGELRLTPVRIVLLLAVVPMAVRLAAGRAGPITAVDWFMAGHAAWIWISLMTNHGLPRLPYAGVTALELFGGYLIGRTLIRSAFDYRLMFRYLLWALLACGPFVLVEFLTDRQYLQEIFRPFLDVFTKPDSSYGRLGFHRVMAGFEHPILFGLFCSMAVANVFYLYRHAPFWRWALLAYVGFLTFTSLSSAPLLSLALQLGLIAWGHISNARWRMLALGLILAYVTVDLLSNRTPVTLVIHYLTFSPGTGWTRIHIWNYGIEEVWRHPLFGIGLNDWARPFWLTYSVDNFWLLTAMRYGIPGFVFLAAAIGLTLYRVSTANGLDAEARAIRLGYLITMVGLFVTLATVHIWGAVSVFVMAYIGAGNWMTEQNGNRETVPRRQRPRHRNASGPAVREDVPNEVQSRPKSARRAVTRTTREQDE